MSLYIKHGLLFFLSISIVFASLFVVSWPVESDVEMKKVRFGLPYPYFTQDMSHSYSGLAFYPNYFKIQWSQISSGDVIWKNLFFSISVVFIIAEFSLFSLEYLWNFYREKMQYKDNGEY